MVKDKDYDKALKTIAEYLKENGVDQVINYDAGLVIAELPKIRNASQLVTAIKNNVKVYQCHYEDVYKVGELEKFIYKCKFN